MNRNILIIALSAMVFSALGQQTNEFRRGRSDGWHKRNGGEGGERMFRQRREERSPQLKEKMKEHRLQLMEKALKEMGITEAQKLEIKELQKNHNQRMKANMKRMGDARKKLSILQNEKASREEIGSAIDAVCNAQKEQLWILVDNRMEMEKIIGQDNFKHFMEAARMQYRKHGGRGGDSGMPRKPKMKEPRE